VDVSRRIQSEFREVREAGVMAREWKLPLAERVVSMPRLEDMVKTLTRLRGKKYRKGGRHTSYFFQWGEIVISCGSSVRVKSGGHDGIL